MDSAVQICAGGNYGGGNGVLWSQRSDNTGHSAVFGLDLCDLCLLDLQQGCFFADLFHVVVVANAVCLYPQAVDSRPFAAVQHTALEKAGISSLSHFAAQSVNLPHQMPFCRAADRRVAGHVGDLIQRYGKQHCAAAKAGRSQGGFYTGMTGTDHSDVISSHVIIFHRYHLN